jgi:hypothetical protein
VVIFPCPSPGGEVGDVPICARGRAAPHR